MQSEKRGRRGERRRKKVGVVNEKEGRGKVGVGRRVERKKKGGIGRGGG